MQELKLIKKSYHWEGRSTELQFTIPLRHIIWGIKYLLIPRLSIFQLSVSSAQLWLFFVPMLKVFISVLTLNNVLDQQIL